LEIRKKTHGSCATHSRNKEDHVKLKGLLLEYEDGKYEDGIFIIRMLLDC